jgi:arylsulfatase A-like enzyme
VRRVIVVLTDGLRPDAISAGLTPWLDALSRDHVTAPEATTVRPSTTVAAIASLATGLAPATHGLTSPGLGFVRRLEHLRPLGLELRRHAMSTQVVTNEIDFVQRTVVAALATAAGVGRLTCTGTTAREVARTACIQAASQRSGLMFVYLNDCDRAGHRDGWMSPAYHDAAAELDGAIEVLSVLAADSLLIVLADHGGGGVRPHDHDEPHPMNDRIPLVLAGPRVARRRRLDGPVSLLDVPPTVLHWLGVPVPASYEGRVLADAFHPRARVAVIAA